MTMNLLQPKDIQNIIEEKFRISVRIDPNHSYCQVEKGDEVRICVYPNLVAELPILQGEIYSFGAILLECYDNSWSLLPEIVQYLINIPYITVDFDKARMLSHGKSVLLNKSQIISEKVSIVVDKNETIIALVRTDGDVIHPILDIGMYLRIE